MFIKLLISAGLYPKGAQFRQVNANETCRGSGDLIKGFNL